MGTPFPNPQHGAAAKRQGGAERERGQGAQAAARTRKPRAAAPVPARASHSQLLAAPPAPSEVPTKFQYVSTPLTNPGPSGIKQCFRTVKFVKRIPILPAPPSEPPPPGSSRKGKQLIKPPKPQEDPAKQPKKHICKFCNKKFSSPGKLHQHNLSHTGELPFSCLKCDKKFNSKFKLVRHNLIHNETRPFSCPTCFKTFHRKDHLTNHERTHNPIKIPYVCEKENCKKQYTSLLSFRKHTALHSAEEGNLECKICSKTFEKQEDIVYHLKVHAGSRTIKNENDKKFKCSVCERKFFTGKDVRRHLVVHTGTRDFPCQFCKQEFGRKDHLVRHMKKAHPNETWQSSTPGPSTSTSFAVLPKPVQPASQKKGKGEAKKSKTKAELKFPIKSPEEIIETSIVKSEQLSVLDQGEVFHYEATPESLLTDDPGIMQLQQQTIFLPREGMVQIKSEPLIENIKVEEGIPGRVLYESLPSTSKEVPVILPTVDSSPSTSMGKFQEYDPNLIFIMSPPPPPYPVITSNIEILQSEEIGYVTRPQTEFEPVILLEEGSGHTEYAHQQIMGMREASPVPEQSQEQKTVLPTFHQAFQSTAQSPKTPQHPPK